MCNGHFLHTTLLTSLVVENRKHPQLNNKKTRTQCHDVANAVIADYTYRYLQSLGIRNFQIGWIFLKTFFSSRQPDDTSSTIVALTIDLTQIIFRKQLQPLTWVRLVTSSALQSQKWQSYCSALCGHLFPVLMPSWTRGAGSRHTTAVLFLAQHTLLLQMSYGVVLAQISVTHKNQVPMLMAHSSPRKSSLFGFLRRS